MPKLRPVGKGRRRRGDSNRTSAVDRLGLWRRLKELEGAGSLARGRREREERELRREREEKGIKKSDFFVQITVLPFAVF